MKLIFVSSVALLSTLFASCGSETKKKTDSGTTAPTTTALKFADVQAIGNTKCVICHGASGGSGGLSLVTLANWKAAKDEAANRMQAIGNVMPQSGRIDSTEDGKKLLEWLKLGDDLK